ncbi:MAG: hypothetical protein ACYCS1_11630 [Gammaproteobacteria bacterium]
MIARMVLALGILSLASVPLCAGPLPILFFPPAHYRILKRLGSSEWFYGGANGAPVNASILRDFRHAAIRAGANAILLRPLCSRSWDCKYSAPSAGPPLAFGAGFGSYMPRGRLPPKDASDGSTFQSYTAEAIRVAGPPCPRPPGLCQLMQPRKPVARNAQSQYRLYKHDGHFIERYRAFGLSLSLPHSARHLIAMQAVRIASTAIKGKMRAATTMGLRGGGCPARYWGSLPIPSDPMLGEIAGNGHVSLAKVVFLRTNNFWASEDLVNLMRHLRFDLKPVGGQPILLLVDWHIVPLAPHQPIPGNVVCWYPGYPARHWQHGRMAAHLRWRGIPSRPGGRWVAIDPVAVWPRSRK